MVLINESEKCLGLDDYDGAYVFAVDTLLEDGERVTFRVDYTN